MKISPPPLPEQESYGWIWKYVKMGKPLTVGSITFYKTSINAWDQDCYIRIPVFETEDLYKTKTYSFDPNPISHSTVFKEFNRINYGIHNSIREAIERAEKTHKREWLAKRAAMRKAYSVWVSQNPDIVKKLENQKTARKNLQKTEAIIEFSKSLTLCRSKLEHMLKALTEGTYTGKMCAELYEACNEVSSAQKRFRQRICKD